MGDELEAWSCEHFSLSLPAGEGQDDVPTLLRAVADQIERYAPTEVQDIVLDLNAMSEDGTGWPSATVYFHRD
jgi:hypothetical protein